MINTLPRHGIHLACKAYCKDDPNDNFIQIISKNESAVVEINDDRINIGIAGSNDWKDLIDNLRIIGTSRKGYGRIPRGFYTNLDNLGHKILDVIKDHQDKPVFISGHSRGGAISFLVAIYLWIAGFTISDIYTYGCPNIGKSGFIKAIKKLKCNVLMYKNGSDIVTTLPWFWLGYKKPCVQIQIGKKRLFPSAKDHLIENYLNSL